MTPNYHVAVVRCYRAAPTSYFVCFVHLLRASLGLLVHAFTLFISLASIDGESDRSRSSPMLPMEKPLFWLSEGGLRFPPSLENDTGEACTPHPVHRKVCDRNSGSVHNRVQLSHTQKSSYARSNVTCIFQHSYTEIRLPLLTSSRSGWPSFIVPRVDGFLHAASKLS